MYWQLIKRMGDAVLDMAKKYAAGMYSDCVVMSGDRYVREKVNGDKCRAEIDPTATLWGVRPKGKVRIGRNSVVYRATLEGNVEIGDNCFVYAAGLSNVKIGDNTALFEVQMADSSLGNGSLLYSVHARRTTIGDQAVVIQSRLRDVQAGNLFHCLDILDCSLHDRSDTTGLKLSVGDHCVVASIHDAEGLARDLYSIGHKDEWYPVHAVDGLARHHWTCPLCESNEDTCLIPAPTGTLRLEDDASLLVFPPFQQRIRLPAGVVGRGAVLALTGNGSKGEDVPTKTVQLAENSRLVIDRVNRLPMFVCVPRHSSGCSSMLDSGERSRTEARFK